jgi:transcriptional regulator with XRE-family HTH domain
MTIGERIKCVRTEKGFTQQKFADALGLKRNTVGGYEIGTVVPSDRTIIDICDKFHVNEDWLRFGEGDMFVSRTREEEIAEFMGALIDGPNNFKKRLISVLANLDEDGWELLEAMALKLAEEEAQKQKENPGQE